MSVVIVSALSSGAVIVPQNDLRSPEGNPDAQKAGTQQHPPEPIWEAVMHEPVAFVTVLLVIVTAGLWLTTFLLWRATVNLAKDAKEDSGIQAGKMERSAAAMERVAKDNKQVLWGLEGQYLQRHNRST